MIEIPEFLTIPDKLLPIIRDFNKYRYFLIEGGRGSAKSWSVAKFILFLSELKKLRVICGREIQNSIEESVFQLLVDQIRQNELYFDVAKNQITHRTTDTSIRFKGFREQGAVSLKSMEGCDLLWAEEAQSITQTSLDIIIPTIRKNNSKIFFTMNRFLRNDPVYEFCSGRDDALIIHIDYFENPWCPDSLIVEAEECKARDPKKYKHIWLGQPLDVAEDYLFNFDKLAKAKSIEPFGDLHQSQSVLAIDFASGGGDLCVASVIKRTSMTHWALTDVIVWDNPDTTISVGKSIALYGQFKPDVFMVDSGGLGYPMFCDISKAVPNVIGFDGAKTDKCAENAGNHRADMYLTFSEWVNNEWIRIDSKHVIENCETIKRKYTANGKIYIQSKQEAKKKGIDSQDYSDSVAMGIFGAKHYLGKATYSDTPIGMRVQRVNKRKAL